MDQLLNEIDQLRQENEELRQVLMEVYRRLQATRPQPKLPGAAHYGPKEYFHDLNFYGQRCFKEQRKIERQHDISNPDPGSAPFPATRIARCAKCGDTIGIGVAMIARQRVQI